MKAQWHRNNNWRRPVPVAKGDADWTRLERKLNWRLYRDYSGGLMTDLGSHQLDVVNWLLGDIPAASDRERRRGLLARRREVCDNVFCLYSTNSRRSPDHGLIRTLPPRRTMERAKPR